MDDSLVRRCTLVLLAAMALALATGLLAWGPVPLEPAAWRHADTRPWLGLPNAGNVLANLPQILVGWCGWQVTRAAPWPAAVRRPWAAFHLCTLAAGGLALLYHLQPGPVGWIAAQTALCGAFAMLALGALAERVDERFGQARPTALLLAGVLLCGAAIAASGGADIRPLMLFELLPVLLLPAGAISLPGRWTRSSDWIVMLLGYGLARLADLHDARLLAATGRFGGHALMHLLLAAVSGWLAYRALQAASGGAPDSQRQASLNTAG